MITENRATLTLRPDEVIEACLTNRHSCRAFLPAPLPRMTIERLLRLAQRTPSWCNTQPWQVHVVSGQRLEQFGAEYVDRMIRDEGRADLELPRAYTGCYQGRRRECGHALYESIGIARGDTEGRDRQALENYRFFGAPHVAVITTERDLGAYGAVDCGGYISVFVLVAESMGISAIPQAAVAMHSDFVRDFLELPQSRQVVAGIAFGHEHSGHPINRFRTRRADLGEVVTWVGEIPG